MEERIPPLRRDLRRERIEQMSVDDELSECEAIEITYQTHHDTHKTREGREIRRVSDGWKMKYRDQELFLDDSEEIYLDDRLLSDVIYEIWSISWTDAAPMTTEIESGDEIIVDYLSLQETDKTVSLVVDETRGDRGGMWVRGRRRDDNMQFEFQTHYDRKIESFYQTIGRVMRVRAD